MALDAGIACCDVIHMRGIDDVAPCGIGGVVAPGAVAAFTAHVPFGDLLGMYVIADRVAAVAQRSSGALHVVRRIVSRPPVARGGHHVVTPIFFFSLFSLPPRRAKQ